MFVNLVFGVIWAASAFSIGAIVRRKMSLLIDLPDKGSKAIVDLKELAFRIKEKFLLNNFSHEILLQKILSKVRVLTLRTDIKTSNWLQKLREKRQKDKFGENDNYWQEVKNSAKPK
ncbi:MAG: hypothetical protein PHW72_02030 [Candidatus Pacebacteria bacterium]|nr:hypothetical protein [Candidatus Paceibacterota bacterium]